MSCAQPLPRNPRFDDATYLFLRVVLVLLLMAQLLLMAGITIYLIGAFADPGAFPDYTRQFNKYPLWASLSRADLFLGAAVTVACGVGMLQRKPWAPAVYILWTLTGAGFNLLNPHGISFFQLPMLAAPMLVCFFYFWFQKFEARVAANENASERGSGPGRGVRRNVTLGATGAAYPSPGSGDRDGLGTFPFVLAGLSFIPLIGVLFGLIVIVWGLATRHRGGGRLALIGAGGIAFTVIIYGALFYFGVARRGGAYDELREQLAQSNLNSAVKTIEFYRLSKGSYPESLDEICPSGPPSPSKSLEKSFDCAMLIDPRILAGRSMLSVERFFYKKIDADHYYLRGVAPDGKPFSPGALAPQVSVDATKLGLVIDPPAEGAEAR
jgi:hypothetical protein